MIGNFVQTVANIGIMTMSCWTCCQNSCCRPTTAPHCWRQVSHAIRRTLLCGTWQASSHSLWFLAPKIDRIWIQCSNKKNSGCNARNSVRRRYAMWTVWNPTCHRLVIVSDVNGWEFYMNAVRHWICDCLILPSSCDTAIMQSMLYHWQCYDEELLQEFDRGWCSHHL